LSHIRARETLERRALRFSPFQFVALGPFEAFPRGLRRGFDFAATNELHFFLVEALRLRLVAFTLISFFRLGRGCDFRVRS
jgi:hypothetical protein